MDLETPQNCQNESRVDSKPEPKQRGGRRPGAGRKPDVLRRHAAQLKPGTARDILEAVDQIALLPDIAKKSSRTLKLNVWIALQDRAYGKPRQQVEVAGRDLRLAGLSNETLKALRRLGRIRPL